MVSYIRRYTGKCNGCATDQVAWVTICYLDGRIDWCCHLVRQVKVSRTHVKVSICVEVGSVDIGIYFLNHICQSIHNHESFSVGDMS